MGVAGPIHGPGGRLHDAGLHVRPVEDIPGDENRRRRLLHGRSQRTAERIEAFRPQFITARATAEVKVGEVGDEHDFGTCE